MYKHFYRSPLTTKIPLLIGLFIAMFYAGSAPTAEVKVADSLKVELLSPTPIGSSVWQMALGLVAVLVVIFLLAWLMRRVTGLQNARGHIKIISAINVGTRERAVLIEVAGEQLLLGVAAGRVNLLHKISTPIPTAKTAAVSPDKTKLDFSSSLQNAVEKLKQASINSTNSTENSTDLSANKTNN
ncbi:MAG: hypothetical protein OFPII_23370 [Osedax symbiont Rs1]|nr:MAG: hypothetical protein OFPII_23370 [Osedax symbiont Rs1]